MAVNRGYWVRVFGEFDAAVGWLMLEEGTSAKSWIGGPERYVDPMRIECSLCSIAESSADALLKARGEISSSDCFPMGSLGPTELSSLIAVLDFEGNAQASIDFTLLAGESQSGPWVVSLPEQLEAAVTAMDRDERVEVAKIWGREAEMGQGRTAGDLVDFLEGLGDYLRSNRAPFAIYIV